MKSPKGCIVLNVHRREPELIAPARPTPHEFKPLSDIDDQEGLRFHIPIIQIYHNDPSMKAKDPVKVIREAVAKTLVFYYPFAGRLREISDRKLVVECTGEGILFIEADADVTIEQAGDALNPPFPFLDELLFDIPGSSGVLNCPLAFIQVTRFRCGGFIFGLRVNHTMIDGPGAAQFMTAIGEMARGGKFPSVMPEWERHVLNARNPPRITRTHREYDDIPDNNRKFPFPLDDVVHRAFFFGPTEISALKNLAPPQLRHCSTFELLTSFLWKSRTIALQPKSTQEMRMICLVNARNRFNPPLIPQGYYGNAFTLSTAIATAGELLKNPISFAIELVRKAKADTTREYVQSVADTLVITGRPLFAVEGTYVISDLRHAGLRDVDFGWGKAKYGGTVRAIPIMASFCVSSENNKGENGFFLPICLPAPAMERFVKELKILSLEMPISEAIGSSKMIPSAL